MDIQPPPTPTKEELAKTILLLCCLVAFLVACFVLRQEYDKHQLRKQLRLLEGTFQQQREKNLLQLDSLQEAVLFQQQVNLRLRDSIGLLGKKRKELKQRTDEEKAAIARIRDVDSLRDEVAEHYR